MKYSESLKKNKDFNIYIEKEILRQQISGHVCTGKWDKSESIRNICKQKSRKQYSTAQINKINPRKL